MSSYAVDLAAALAAQWGAGLTAALVAAPVNVGVGLSAETALLAQQLVQAQRESLLGIGERLALGARKRHDVAFELRIADGDAVDALEAHARTADLLVTSQRNPAGPGGLSTGQAARHWHGSTPGRVRARCATPCQCSRAPPRWSFSATRMRPRRCPIAPGIAPIALGAFTFTMTALPGTPAIQNAIPMPFFGATPFAAPGLGANGGAVMLGVGWRWIARRAKLLSAPVKATASMRHLSTLPSGS